MVCCPVLCVCWSIVVCFKLIVSTVKRYRRSSTKYIHFEQQRNFLFVNKSLIGEDPLKYYIWKTIQGYYLVLHDVLCIHISNDV